MPIWTCHALLLVGCATTDVVIKPDAPTVQGKSAETQIETGAATSNPIETSAATEPLQPVVFSDVTVSSTDDAGTPLAIGTVSDVQASFRDATPINLPSALAAVGGSHPIVANARWRTQEAYAELAAAKVLWLPSIRSGVSVHRHDGNYQASNGDIVDVNRNSLQYGLGQGGTGAGTTQRPGVIAEFHLADAIFAPAIAKKTAWARGHSANATLNAQLRDVAIAYTNLVRATLDVSILESSRANLSMLAKLVDDFAAAGEGLQADADRTQAELSLIANRILMSEQSAALASAQLVQAMSISSDQQLTPMEVNAVPLIFHEPDAAMSQLISMGLRARPELKAAQALVAAACDAYQRQKLAPMVPSVLLGFSTGGFGGGLRSNLDDVSSRYDFDAVVSWEVRQLGFGEKAARQVASARVQQARYAKLQQMDQVAAEISQALAGIKYARQRIRVTEQAIPVATDSFERNRERIIAGEGLPIEVLQSVQALETAQREYLSAVMDHNEAQFQLQWALGFPPPV
ncbi:MAG: TolC family protein [Planctomycetota bacterium]